MKPTNKPTYTLLQKLLRGDLRNSPEWVGDADVALQEWKRTRRVRLLEIKLSELLHAD